MNSEPKEKFTGVVKNGIIIHNKPLSYSIAIKRLEGQEVEYTLAPRFVQATSDQHGYYRASIRWLIDNIESFGGWEQEALHNFFARKFLSHRFMEKIIWPDGKEELAEFVHVAKTSTIGKKRMAEYITNVWAYLAERGIYVPESESVDPGKYATRVKIKKNESDKK
jgi:hypothetical protein